LEINPFIHAVSTHSIDQKCQ